MAVHTLSLETFGQIAVVHAPEELAREHAEVFRQAVASLSQKKIVLDLDHTELLDSAGLTSLMDLADDLRATGGELKVATSDATNRKILEITRLDQYFEVYATVLEAVRSFRQEHI